MHQSGLHREHADVVLAALLLLALLPVLIALALAIKLDSRGPVLFRQRRLGLERQPFTILKFRTMRHGAPSEPHERFIRSLAASGVVERDGLNKLTDDARVTRLGAWLRRTSLDELPQLLNVLRGEMVLVGPRPALAYELQYYDAHHYERFAVPPGLTGLWQVSGRARLGLREMLDLDVEYARERSLWLDLRILWRTPSALAGTTA